MTGPAISDLTGTYTIDSAHSRIGFSARHAMVTKVRGHFAAFEGTATLDAADPSNSVAALTIEVQSIDTAQAQRDEHLRTNDFFDAAAFPTITFTSTGVTVIDAENFLLLGDLTIKGVTKAVSIEFEHTGTARDPYGNLRAGFEGKAVINRKDFGIAFNATLETGGVLVGEKITLDFDISAIKQ